MAVVKQNIQSTVKPKEVEFNDKYVYINSNIQESDGMYTYTVRKYEKDEFIMALSDGQVLLNDRTTMIEDALLEISEVIYA